MASPGQWIEGARLRTLPMAVAPVIVGTAAAYDVDESLHWVRALMAAAVALLLQIGVNYSNDYSDGIRGTDDARVGPLRLTASGLAEPKHVKYAAFACFGLAALVGAALVVVSQAWPLLLVGAAAVFAAWGYTGGKNPYGYQGLGDIFVFLFFGLVATLGTTFTQVLQLTAPAWVGAISTGLIASALLMANNVRDIPTDRVAGKRTLAVRLGDEWARATYVLMLAAALLLPLLLLAEHPWLMLVALIAPLCIAPSLTMMRAGHEENAARGALIPVLKQTGVINLGYAGLFAVGMAITVVLRNS
ncbi:1,4-dihydroxy-2-naphthoate polyprenyltransferase [Zhihengliuella halotolerans]|uniref:1,4-dihydroxy-2-naphthoate octaprenyltransferase n=1 Tax=Zhihengliuella halotolerans TaxID=370736 RepID=A0A4Q8ADK6_9MICC|nr:1,4-dihydroxy-2-naphthoate polyprenyltransferase [Zhihengliuella halotolerans]RZU62330.1 1,4-dihydroxy-2-naphthoate prenyltransferase [Zhihengliuella halotolerans]